MSRSNFFSKKLETAKTLASNFSTDPIDITTIDNLGVNVSASSVTDNTGSFFIDHRIYKDANNFSDWAELTLSSTPQLADADATLLINLNQLPHGQMRLRFVAAGSTPDGVADVWVSGKEI